MNPDIPKHQRAVDAVRASEKRQRHRIRGVMGLCLELHPTGRRAWQVRYQIGKGRTRLERWVSIGSAADVPLARAIAKTQEIRANAVLDGRDEVAVRRAAASPETVDWLFKGWSRSSIARWGFGRTETKADIGLRLCR